MKKTLFAAIALVSLSVASPAFADGFAAIASDSSTGKVGAAQGKATDEAAREAAMEKCFSNGGRKCDLIVSNPAGYSFAAIECDGQPMVGSSKHGQQAAVSIAEDKADQLYGGYEGCGLTFAFTAK